MPLLVEMEQLVKVNKTTRVPSLPPKTWWPCTAKGFVEQRRVLLMKYVHPPFDFQAIAYFFGGTILVVWGNKHKQESGLHVEVAFGAMLTSL